MAGIARRVTGAVLLAMGLGVGGAEPAGAQERGLLGAGAAFFGAGASRIATGELEDRLAARGYPTFGRTAMALSLGAYRILPGGVALGGEWHGLIMGEQAHEGREVGLGGGYGTLGLGYVVELSPRARVYPRIGLGGGGMGLWIENDSSEVGFDEVLADPKPTHNRPPVLSRGGVVVDLGAGAELLLGGLLVGLRLGYLAAPFDTNWQLYDYSVNDGPAATIAGPYVRAVVGVGRRRGPTIPTGSSTPRW